MSEQLPAQSGQNLNILDSALEGVQIGGIAGGDLTVNQTQRVYVTNVYETVDVSSAPLAGAQTLGQTPLSQKEYRWRQVLLDKVKQYWIDGVLAQSLHAKVFIELGLSDRPELIQTPADAFAEFSPNQTPAKNPLPTGARASDIFEDIGAGRTLLILGEPGSGKTVTLLKLAASLVKRVENNLSQPLPVVLNLSSWAKQRGPIESWLVQAIYQTYGASKSLCEAWVEQEQLILLLDGLDEVDARYRNDCVKALNQFVGDRGLTELVVCSRIRDYQALSERLKLRSAICVQPLSAQQIDRFLGQAGESLSALKALLETDAELRAMATSPLMLSIMSLTYQNRPVDSLIESSSTEQRRKQLFDAYIERLFSRRSTTEAYTREKVLRWLIWLAQYMEKTSQSIFWIERMQPDCLLERARRSYKRVLSVMLVAILGAFPGFLLGVIAGIAVAIQEGHPIAITALLGGIVMAVILGLFSMIFVGVWMFFERGGIKTFETLKWSWQAAKNSIPVARNMGLLYGTVSMLFFILAGIVSQQVAAGIAVGLFFFLYLLLFYTIFAAIIGGFRGPTIARTSFPNQGIFSSARNGLKFFLPGSLFFGTVSATAATLGGANSSSVLGGALYWGVLASLWGGCFACLQHVALRYVLFRRGAMPWNYARFLNYAVDRLFLQRVGGGYIFIHRMLLEHFAAMASEQ